MNKAVWISSGAKKRWAKRTPAAAGSGEADIALSGNRYQTVEGIGGCFNELGAIALKAMPPQARKRLLDQSLKVRLRHGRGFLRRPGRVGSRFGVTFA